MRTIVIVGGGAGGLELATRLGDSAGKAGHARVILVDRWPAHFWKPLLHTVASGARDPQHCEIEYSAQAAGHGFEFSQGEVRAIDRGNRTIELAPWIGDDGREVLPARRIGYDKLVLALGSVTNFFDVPGAAENVLTLDSVAEAEVFRKRFVGACIQASARKAQGEPDGAAVNIIIVGGGATGVELAAELSHTARTLAKYHVHALDPVRDVRIRLLERGEYLLPHLHRRLSRRAARHLRSLGIEVRTNTAVASVGPDGMLDSAGTRHDATITLWAAGVEAPALCATLGLSVNRLRQIVVGPTLQSVSDPDIFAIGDCANFVCPVQGVVPPRAQAAHQQALFLAHALAQRAGAPPPSFKYHDYGSFVSLGPLAAVGVLAGTVKGRKYQVGGAAARLIYRLMYRKHLLALHGFARMAAHTVADWIRARLAPSVKLY
ncbi:NAD(P)/FAD-dependent oxidoreductase [Massilia glaciei]|uniref:NAD(P)/FAD-dependent oxidoreductase n=1 Tax=Massilia glaciei TaxID=1524097 RepID=A0A2U2HIF2_9BURK|nr:NAD(P)/FAD-dependent oxidoreductase [Massilia glaciei]PWF46150.1 NAD(P)/FAD-dependent oxidoreductase [Massilia glaciei]